MKILIILCLSFSTFSLISAQTTVEERMAKLEEKIEELEIDRAFDRVKLSGTFIGYFERINSRTKDASTDEITNNKGDVASMHIGINIDFAINENFNFYSTLAMGKVLNNDGRTGIEESSYRSLQGSYGYSGSEAKFDVAYLNWKMLDGRLGLALGRMTTRGGPPLNQLDALYRSGTYPRFGYNAIFDGVAAIYDFKDMVPKDMGFKTRLFYTPYYFIDPSDRTQPAMDPDGNEIKRRSDQLALLNEWELDGSQMARKVSIYSLLWYYDNFYDDEYQDSTRAGIELFAALSHTLYFGLEEIADTGFNFSWSYLLVDSKLSGDEKDKSDSSLFNINYAFKNSWVVGFEQIYTDEAFYLDEWAYLQFNEFYQRSNNNGQHYFVAIPFAFNQVLRFGMYNYRAGVSEPNLYDYTERTHNYYTSYRVDF
jgi:hypothetical protein